MATTIAGMMVELSLNTAKFTSGVEKANKSLGSIQKALSIIKFDAIVNLGRQAMATAEQIYNLAYSLASFGSDMTRTAQTMGMSISQFQQWRYVGKNLTGRGR